MEFTFSDCQFYLFSQKIRQFIQFRPGQSRNVVVFAPLQIAKCVRGGAVIWGGWVKEIWQNRQLCVSECYTSVPVEIKDRGATLLQAICHSISPNFLKNSCLIYLNYRAPSKGKAIPPCIHISSLALTGRLMVLGVLNPRAAAPCLSTLSPCPGLRCVALSGQKTPFPHYK